MCPRTSQIAIATRGLRHVATTHSLHPPLCVLLQCLFASDTLSLVGNSALPRCHQRVLSSEQGSSLEVVIKPHHQDMAPRPAAPFYLPYVVPVVAVATQYSTVAWHSLLAPIFVWVVVPLLDTVVWYSKEPVQRLSAEQRRELEAQWSFKAAVLLWCPVQLLMLCWSVGCAADETIDWVRLIGLLSSMSLVSAEGINCSHELLHRNSYRDRLTAQLLLVSSCYGHFFIEHARGHHKFVATPQDAATMALGENFYQFLPKTVLGGFRSAWRLERKRLAEDGCSVLSVRNAMLWYMVSPIMFFVVPFWAIFGVRGVCFFLAQSVIAVSLLEQVNAMEHYGLQRRQLSDGTYETIGPQHSWDAPYTVSNRLMFMLQRHSDHHLHPGKRYQCLDITPESPQLPAGYLALAPCLLIPPLWRAVIHPVLFRYLSALEKMKQ
jgi:alkane 1-monooxygenase